jgi:ketosteroid isomerase-like protein
MPPDVLMAGDRRGSPVAFVKVGMMDSEKQPALAARKQAVQQYFEGFRRSDHEAILALLSDDVVWDLPGFRHLEGRAAFDSEIENPDFEGSPRIEIDRFLADGDTVVAYGTGETLHRQAGPMRFAYCDVFTFAGALVRRVESYVVPLDGQGGA